MEMPKELHSLSLHWSLQNKDFTGFSKHTEKVYSSGSIKLYLEEYIHTWVDTQLAIQASYVNNIKRKSEWHCIFIVAFVQA